MIQVFFYCCRNLGDDLFLKMLLRRYPQQQFYLNADPRYTSHIKEKNLRVVGKLSFFASRVVGKLNKNFLRKIQSKKTTRCDAAIRIGGSIFIERNNASQTYYPEKNDNFFILGANFGPYKTQRFYDTRKAKIQAAADCCFRDIYSYNLFKNLKNVRYAPDILFGYPNLPDYEEGDCVGVSVIDFFKRVDLQPHARLYEEGIVKLCNYWTEKGKAVKLLAFCVDDGDVDAINRVFAGCDNPDMVERVLYSGDSDAFLKELNSCFVIYATRFHAMVLGWTMRKRVVPVIYSEKQTHVIEDMGFSGVIWDILHGKPIPNKAVSAQTNPLSEKQLAELKRKSSGHFKKLDEFIGNL